jgi:hypothetical protein
VNFKSGKTTYFSATFPPGTLRNFKSGKATPAYFSATSNFSATSPPGTLRNFKSGKAMSASGDIAIKRDALV